MNEPAQPDCIPFEPSEDIGDFTDAPNDDPGASIAVRFAGCSVNDELDSLGANTNV
jgi:hypothetical protein